MSFWALGRLYLSKPSPVMRSAIHLASVQRDTLVLARLDFGSLADSSRKSPVAAALTDAEAITLMRSSAAYTGKYDLDEVEGPDGSKIIIHVDAASNQALVGTDRVFFARSDGERLQPTSPAVVVSSGSISVVQLEFVRSDQE